MFKQTKNIVALLAISGLMFAFTGCEKPAGPAETAGKKVDQAVEKTGQQIEKAGEKMQDAAKGNNK